MFNKFFAFTFIAVVVVLITRDALSTPQIGAQFGEIHNNGTGGGNNLTPYGEGGNSSASLPGSGYPDHYYENHSNETAPTSPSMSGGSLNMQNSSLPTSTCDCSQITNVQETASSTAPTNGPSDAPSSSSSE